MRGFYQPFCEVLLNMSKDFNYYDTFIQVAPDCPVKQAVVPVSKGENKTVAVHEYECLSAKPYFYTQEELFFTVHVRRLGISAKQLKSQRDKLWAEFFATPHACMRASALTKKYGWGVHYDHAGKMALIAMQDKKYQQFARDRKLKQLLAMKSRKG